MYAVEATVTRLVKNRKPPETDFAALASIVDSEIDAALSGVFWWPYDEQGELVNTDPPEQIKSAASLMVAGLIEWEAYAHIDREDPTVPNYGRQLDKRGRDIIAALCSGNLFAKGLVARTPGHIGQPEEQYLGVSVFSGRGNVSDGRKTRFGRR